MFAENPYVAGNPVGDSPAFVGQAGVLRHPRERHAAGPVELDNSRRTMQKDL